MKHVLECVCLLTVAAWTGGCGARMAVVSVEKTTYVVKQGNLGFNSDLWFCEVVRGQPICTRVEEHEP